MSLSSLPTGSSFFSLISSPSGSKPALTQLSTRLTTFHLGAHLLVTFPAKLPSRPFFFSMMITLTINFDFLTLKNNLFLATDFSFFASFFLLSGIFNFSTMRLRIHTIKCFRNIYLPWKQSPSIQFVYISINVDEYASLCATLLTGLCLSIV